ncbi:MAG: hypothetical protein HZB38_17330, partial [Planctomycetes bacterium]|nr:hypothetical protein [Planctomycetota bacterium]
MNPARPAGFGALHPTFEIHVGGLVREYLVHAAPTADSSSPLPVVLMCHGGGGSAKTAATSTRLSDKADAMGFLAVYPQAVPLHPGQPVTFLRNPTFWNVGAGFGHAERIGIDDVAYVGAVLDDLSRRFPIDPSRIYVAGFSNGAAMAMRAAIDLSGRFAAVAAIAGHLWRKTPPPAHPLPLLYMIGEDDPVVPRAGGVVHSPWGDSHTLPPVSDTVDCWVRWLGLPATPEISEPAAGVYISHY